MPFPLPLEYYAAINYHSKSSVIIAPYNGSGCVFSLTPTPPEILYGSLDEASHSSVLIRWMCLPPIQTIRSITNCIEEEVGYLSVLFHMVGSLCLL